MLYLRLDHWPNLRMKSGPLDGLTAIARMLKMLMLHRLSSNMDQCAFVRERLRACMCVWYVTRVCVRIFVSVRVRACMFCCGGCWSEKSCKRYFWCDILIKGFSFVVRIRAICAAFVKLELFSIAYNTLLFTCILLHHKQLVKGFPPRSHKKTRITGTEVLKAHGVHALMLT